MRILKDMYLALQLYLFLSNSYLLLVHVPLPSISMN